MLSKKKAARRAAITATVRKESKVHREAVQQRKQGVPATAGARFKIAGHAAEGEGDNEAHPQRRVLTKADAMEAGSGAGSRAELIRSLGDHIDTRLQDITFEDDLNGDVFHERRAQLMEEARLAAGVKQRVVSTSVRDYLGHQAELRDLHTVRIAHNCNSITCVAALGSDRIVYGDKSGKVYLVDVSLTTSGTGVVASDTAEAQRRRKVLLEPVLPAGVVSIAVSDTTANRPTTRDVFEKTTVDMSCPSYVAAGAMDGSISVWETLSKTHKGLLFMHRKPITGLRFRMDTATLYSCCEDGTLRVWSVPQMMAVDKLFGHEGAIHFIDGLRKETAATVGEDGTMRFWKIDAATQQAYTYAPTTSTDRALGDTFAGPTQATTAPNVEMEAVAMLNEGIVVAGARNGSIVVFDLNRRKPLIVVPAAHGYGFIGDGTGLEKAAAQLAEEDERARVARSYPAGMANKAAGATSSSSSSLPPASHASGVGEHRNPNPITAVAAVPYADVIASASYDGVVRVWQVAGVGAGATAPGRRTAEGIEGQAEESTKRLEPQLVLVAALPVPAIVNALRFSDSGDVLYVAMAKEPRRGRWVVQSTARNGVLVVPLTESGRRGLQGVSGELEHIPAQLFGIDDAAVEDGSDRDSASHDGGDRGAGAARLSAEMGSSGGHLPFGEDDLSGPEDVDEAQEEEADPEVDMFTVGPDGMLRFKEGVSSTATKAALSTALKRKKKGKKSGMPKVLRHVSAAYTPSSSKKPEAGESKKLLKKSKKGKSVAGKAKADASKEGVAAVKAKVKRGKVARKA
jgi:ribosomal RNA-processing protein 9